VTNLELLVACGGYIRSLGTITASLGQRLGVLLLRIITAAQDLIIELLDVLTIGTTSFAWHEVRGRCCVARREFPFLFIEVSPLPPHVQERVTVVILVLFACETGETADSLELY
jgi:hypothetical protein